MIDVRTVIRTYQTEIIVILVGWYILKRSGIIGKLGMIRDNSFAMAQHTLITMGYDRNDVSDTLLILKGDMRLLLKRWKNARNRTKTYDKVVAEKTRKPGKKRGRPRKHPIQIPDSLPRPTTGQMAQPEDRFKAEPGRISEDN